ncbi:MAG TPA: hypothetical protein VGV93_05915, partial [Acidimicrobiales bacterium]|nr:hypothetical protein [Acidimicrobiales bacterium]
VGPGVWTGTELISWQSGLAYNPETDTWRRIAPSPLAPRMDEAVTALRGGVLVWGGCNRIEVPNCDDALEAPLTDGALYDPATDSWTMLPDSPLGAGAGTLAVTTAWNDQAIIVVPHPQDPEAPTVAALDPATLEWQELAPLPKEAGKRGSALVWTGTHVIAWGGYTDSPMEETAAGLVLNPVLDQWRPLPAGGGGRRGHTALWTPHGLLIAGGQPTAQPVLFTPASGEPVAASTTLAN